MGLSIGKVPWLSVPILTPALLYCLLLAYGLAMPGLEWRTSSDAMLGRQAGSSWSSLTWMTFGWRARLGLLKL